MNPLDHEVTPMVKYVENEESFNSMSFFQTNVEQPITYGLNMFLTISSCFSRKTRLDMLLRRRNMKLCM